MEDADLKILDMLNNDELDTLVKVITKKGSLTETLTVNEDYIKYNPDHTKYIGPIKKELSLMGGNTIANIVRGDGVKYREILIDVCKHMKVPFNKNASTARIESCLLEKVLEEAWEKMSDEEKVQLLAEAGEQVKGFGKQIGAAGLIAIFHAGGFASYQIALIIANSVAKFVFGRGLALAANATLTRALGVLTGPIGVALTALWTAIDIAGPAYRVTIPATVYIASLRYLEQGNQLKNLR